MGAEKIEKSFCFVFLPQFFCQLMASMPTSEFKPGIADDEVMAQIHEVTGGNFRGVDMLIPRILELKQRNRQRLEEGSVKMQDIVKTAASRIMI